MHRDHEPQRRVGRVELGRLAAIGETVGQQAVLHGARPLEQDRPRGVRPPHGQAEPTQGDEGVAPPVGEPGVAGDDRAPVPAPHEVGVGRTTEPRRMGGAGGGRVGSQALPERHGVPFEAASVRGERQHRRIARQVESEDAGRAQVLHVVEAARAFLFVEERPIPVRLVRVGAVRESHHLGQGVVGPPRDTRALDGRVEAERSVLVVQRVEIAAGQERPHLEPGRTGPAFRAPSQEDARFAGNDQQLLDHPRSVGERPGPGGPGIGRERRESRGAVGRDHAGGVALRRQRQARACGVDEGVDSVHEHHAACGRSRCDEQQRVVPARAEAGDGARRETAQAVGLQVFAGVADLAHPLLHSRGYGRNAKARAPPAGLVSRSSHGPLRSHSGRARGR